MSEWIRYRATMPTGGSLEFTVVARYLEEEKTDVRKHEYIAHEAWREMLKDRDALGRPVRNNYRRLLMQVIDKIGVDKAKAQFTKSLQFERITP